jgi:hypothetical protein
MGVFYFICQLLALLLWAVAAIARLVNARLNTSWMTPAGLFLFFLPTVIEGGKALG